VTDDLLDTGDRIEGYPELGGSAWAFGLGS